MTLEVLTFGSEINFSLQVGDVVYYAPITPVGGFDTVNSAGNIVKFGIVTALFPNGDLGAQIPANSIVVVFDNNAGVSPPQLNDYIMFDKNKEVNSSSLIGYYAEVTFTNPSPNEAKLFAVSSEVSESSK